MNGLQEFEGIDAVLLADGDHIRIVILIGGFIGELCHGLQLKSGLCLPHSPQGIQEDPFEGGSVEGFVYKPDREHDRYCIPRSLCPGIPC